MMRAKARGTFPAAMKETSPPPPSVAAAVKEDEWEVRPGGMLVQKRSPDSDAPVAPVPNIRVKVKFNGVCHEIYISAQASFGELKKTLSAKTGLHPEDQKIVYKDKERDSKAFLDMAGVKDRSKMVMLEDPAAKAKRLLEERRTSKAERAAKAISRITLDVDKLATKVVNPAGARLTKGSWFELLLHFGCSFGAGVGAGDHRGQGWESGGRRRGDPHRGAHERAGQAGLRRRRGRGQGAATNAGERVRGTSSFLAIPRTNSA
jgi:hypothetical protein